MTGERNHHRRNKNARLKSKIERFLSVRLFLILGGIFILIGVFNTFSLLETAESMHRFLSTIIHSSENPGNHIKINAISLGIIFTYFLIPVFILIVFNFFAKKHAFITYTASIIVSIYLIIMQLRVLILIYIHQINFYPNFLLFTLFLFLPAILLVITAILHRKWSILIFAGLYFYTSLLIYAVCYDINNFFLFSYSYIFSILMYWVGRKINDAKINLGSFIFAIGFLFQYWLRNYFHNSNIETFEIFLIYAFINYLIFNLIYILTSSNKEKPLNKWMQLILSWTNLLFILGCFNFVYAHYYVVLALIIILLASNIGILLYIKKYNISIWKFPLHYSIILLISLFLPILIRQNMILLFTAGLSISSLYYTIYYKDRIASWISITSGSIMSIYFLFLWIKSYFIVLISKIYSGDYALLWHGIISGAILIIAFSFNIWLLKKNELPLSKKTLSKREYLRFLRGSLLFIIFLSLAWLAFSISCFITNSTNYTYLGLYIAWSCFSIVNLHNYLKNESIFRRPILIFSMLVAFLYPFLVHLNMVNYRNFLIQNHYLDNYAITLHFIAVVLFIYSGILTIKLFFRLFRDEKLRNGLNVLTISFIMFILFTEYDNISILITILGISNMGDYIVNTEILFLNHHLPYTILMWLLSIAVFIWAINYRNRFIRSISIIIFVITIIKLLFYDFVTLNTEAKNIIYIFSGISLIGFAILYRQFSLKPDSKQIHHHRHHSHSHRRHKSSSVIEANENTEE
ncbi:MAG: DUF2339 domain-containing protein [Bacteroidetes bacterium]|nr:DUF2339 domain-containing protein [Bacteroidota bacterium]